MESSKLFGGTEECSSSESGWTTYIASPAHRDDTQDEDYEEDDDDDDAGDHEDEDDGKDGNDDSDDSMASDASTGPNHGVHDRTHLKHDQEEDDNKCCSYTKVYREKEKKTNEERGREAVKQGSVVMANSATSSVHSGVKVRKARWIEKGK